MADEDSKIPGVKSTRLTKEEILIKTKILVKMETMTMRRGIFNTLSPCNIPEWQSLTVGEKGELLRERGVALLTDRDKDSGRLLWAYVLLDDQTLIRAMVMPESSEPDHQWGNQWQFLLDLPRVQVA